MGWSASQTPSLLCKTFRRWSSIAMNSSVSRMFISFPHFFALFCFHVLDADDVNSFQHYLPRSVRSLALPHLPCPTTLSNICPRLERFSSCILLRHPSDAPMFSIRRKLESLPHFRFWICDAMTYRRFPCHWGSLAISGYLTCELMTYTRWVFHFYFSSTLLRPADVEQVAYLFTGPWIPWWITVFAWAQPQQ